MQKKNIIYVMLCLIVAVLLSGCNSAGTGKDKVSATPAPTTPGVTIPPVSGLDGEPTIAPLQNIEVSIYTLNPATLEKQAITVLAADKKELTPEFIIEQVVVAMEDEGFFLGINDIVLVGTDGVRIDFQSDAVPVVNVDASVEGFIIDCLAQSILDNLSQYKKIYISIEGGPYRNGHLERELDEVYLGR